MAYVLVHTATHYPHKDIFTGTEVGPFIDTGYDIEGPYGTPMQRIYLAVSTIREIAVVAGVAENLEDAQRYADAQYNKGKFDAVKEGLGGDVLRVADSLGAIAAQLAR